MISLDVNIIGYSLILSYPPSPHMRVSSLSPSFAYFVTCRSHEIIESLDSSVISLLDGDVKMCVRRNPIA